MEAISIEALDEGFIIETEEEKRFAVGSLDQLVEKVRRIFGNNQTPELPEPPEDVIILPEHASEDARHIEPVMCDGTDKAAVQGINQKELRLEAFEFDKSKMQKLGSVSFQELEDRRVVLEYAGSHYYTTKDLVLKIPYPFPRGTFTKENGWCSINEQAFKKYRRHLADVAASPRVEKPIDFIVRAGNDGAIIEPKEASRPLFIPEFKSRKQKVEEFLAEGLTKEQIAERMKMSPDTLERIIATMPKVPEPVGK